MSASAAASHLLAINFRDPAHPEAGGAELHLDHILREAVARGWRVSRGTPMWFAIDYRAGDGRTVAGAVLRGRGPPSGAAELPVVTSACRRGTH